MTGRLVTESAAALVPIVADAARRVGAGESPGDLGALVDTVAARLGLDDCGGELPGVDPYLAEGLLYGLFRTAKAAALADVDERADAHLGLEQMRQSLAYIAAAAPADDSRPTPEIVRALLEATRGSADEVAAVLGVNPRTLSRWEKGQSEPATADAARLRLTAKLVNTLRHSLTGPGTLLWLVGEHPDLGARPADRLDDPGAYAELLRLAARTRSSAAA